MNHLPHHCIFPSLFVVLIALSSCQGEDDSVVQGHDPIAGRQGQGGIPIQAGDPGAKSTVALMVESPTTGTIQKNCTGSLISSSHVVTAAHCIKTAVDGYYSNVRYIAFGFDLRKKNIEKRKIKRILFHQLHAFDKKNFLEMKKRWGKATVVDEKNDIALIEFEGGLPPNFEPIPLATRLSSVAQGVDIRIVGYGMTEITEIVSNALLRYGVMTSRGLVDEHDFTASPKAPDNFNPCYGDSGGPALVLEDDTWKLAGIAATILEENGKLCEKSGASYTLVPAFQDWIETARARLIKLQDRTSVMEVAHPVDDEGDDFVNFVNSCEKATPGSEEEHTYQWLKALTHQGACRDAALVLFGFTHINLDYLNGSTGDNKDKGLVGDPQTATYPLGEIAQTPLTSAKPFAYLHNVAVLSLANHRLKDISPLGRMSNLRVLDLRHNELTAAHLHRFGFFSNRKQLEVLDLSQNTLNSLEGIDVLDNLLNLNLSEDNLTSLSPLQGLNRLRFLGVGSNQISDLTPLLGKVQLYKLDLGNNAIQDLSPLSTLTYLTRLSLNHNLFTDLAPLSNLTRLEYLDLKDNPQLSTKSCPLPETAEKKVCEF